MSANGKTRLYQFSGAWVLTTKDYRNFPTSQDRPVALLPLLFLVSEPAVHWHRASGAEKVPVYL